MNYVWTVSTPEPHTVTLVVNGFSGRETVMVDGAVVTNEVRLLGGSDRPIPVGGKTALLSVQAGFLFVGFPRCKLAVDGREIPPTEAPSAPAWAWLLALPCFAMVAVGGAIGGGIGFGSGMGIVVLCGKKDLPVVARVVISLGIIGLAWFVLLAIAAAIAR